MEHGWKRQALRILRPPRPVYPTAQPASGCSVVQMDLPRCVGWLDDYIYRGLFIQNTHLRDLTLCAKRRRCHFGLLLLLTNCCCSACCSARVLQFVFVARSSLGYQLRSVSNVMQSRGTAGRDIRPPAALVMPPRSCATIVYSLVTD